VCIFHKKGLQWDQAIGEARKPGQNAKGAESGARKEKKTKLEWHSTKEHKKRKLERGPVKSFDSSRGKKKKVKTNRG